MGGTQSSSLPVLRRASADERGWGCPGEGHVIGASLDGAGVEAGVVAGRGRADDGVVWPIFSCNNRGPDGTRAVIAVLDVGVCVVAGADPGSPLRAQRATPCQQERIVDNDIVAGGPGHRAIDIQDDRRGIAVLATVGVGRHGSGLEPDTVGPAVRRPCRRRTRAPSVPATSLCRAGTRRLPPCPGHEFLQSGSSRLAGAGYSCDPWGIHFDIDTGNR